jgi:hypothetical protein
MMPVVITKARAVALVEALLVRKPELAIADVEQHSLGWLVSCQSAEYLRSRVWEKQLVGLGPYLVDGQDGSIHYIPITTFMNEDWAQMYREDIKGIKLPDPLLDAVREITVRDGAMAGLRHLRRQTSALSVLEAKTYIDSVRDGSDPPAELALRAHPRPERTAFPIETITGPDARTGPGTGPVHT